MESKEAILSQSYQLFHKYGIKSVTMDDISKKLSISKKTLYKHFANKKELVNIIMETQIKATEEQCVSLFNNSENAIHELFLVMEMLKMIFHNINPSLLYDLQKYHKDAWELMENHQNGFVFDMIKQTLNRGVTEGHFRKNLNINILTKLRLEEMKASFNPEIFSPNEYNIEEVQIVMLEHFILGVTTLEGHQLAIDYQKKLNT